MTSDDRLWRQLTEGLTDLAGTSTSDHEDDILRQVARTRQRPAWTFPERWLPMAVITRPALAPPLRMAWFMLIALLVLAIAAGGAIVGSRLFGATAPPIPQGGAAVFAYHSLGDIFTVRADGTDQRRLTSGQTSESAPSWSPDGGRIAYRAWDGTDSIQVMDGDGRNVKVLATTSQPRSDCLGADFGWGGDPAWSPDGRSLIYPTSASCDDRYDLFIVATDGSSTATRLLTPGLNGALAAWSPDGSTIALVGREATGGAGLYVADVGPAGALAGGLEARRITDASAGMDWMEPRWSPDGTELAASAGTNDNCVEYDSGTLDVFTVRADGSSQRALAAEAAKEYIPTWSPTGERLAFTRLVDPAEWKNDRPCTTSTWVVDADGSNERRLEGFGPDPVPPLWSPDGTRISGAGPTQDSARLGLYFVTVDASSPLVIVEVNNDLGGGSWQPFAVPFPLAPAVAASPRS